MDNNNTIRITLGDLVVALTDEVALFVNDENEANLLVAHVLSNLLSSQRPSLH